jgi:isopentenyl diphosphate isomerase/L-lactate dehydrogenase-like FMN-dependent dehydrogenase
MFMAGAAIVGMGRPACKAADAEGIAGVGRGAKADVCKVSKEM